MAYGEHFPRTSFDKHAHHLQVGHLHFGCGEREEAKIEDGKVYVGSAIEPQSEKIAEFRYSKTKMDGRSDNNRLRR